MSDLIDSREKICLVTGANSGIGQGVASELAKHGAAVIMLCRDKARGESARDEIKRASDGHAMDLMIADLSSQQDIRRLVQDFKTKYPRLDVLVNCAAVFKTKRTTTVDGLETMFATNHLAPFMLTLLLLDCLKASSSARVLNVTAPSTVKLDFDDLQGERRFRYANSFGATKAANLLFTFELARRLEGTDIVVNAIHPGLVRSNLMREHPALIQVVINLFSMPPERAAPAIVRVALATEFARTSGRFCRDGKEIKAPAHTRDPHVQNRLWQVSADLTRVEL